MSNSGVANCEGAEAAASKSGALKHPRGAGHGSGNLRGTATKNAEADLADELVALIPGLRLYARNLLRGGSEVDDLVQETLVKALANLDGFRQGTNLRAWLFTIMRNSFLTRIARSAREPVGEEDCVSGKVITLPRHDAQIMGNQVMAAIDRLPPHYREALILVFLTGESYQEVARICGCALGTVKSRINWARHMIMEDLGATQLADLIA